MSRLHIHLKVKDLADSVGFYSTLFAVRPTLLKEDYAKWMLEEPRVNFSLRQAQGEALGGVEHLGIEAEEPSELADLRARLARLEGGTRSEEGETVCCYHASDKTWVADDQGISWEIFHTSGQVDATSVSQTSDAPGAAPCCAEDCCPDSAETTSP